MTNKENIENIKILIIGINFILAIAFFSSLFLIAYNVKNNQTKEFISSFQSIIPIAAAWLVLCIANRQIKIDQANIIMSHKINLIQSTHFLIVIVTDLKNRNNYFKHIIENKSPYFDANILLSLAKSISDRYEQLIQEKDSYKFVTGPTIKKILDISGSIFGITNLINSISADPKAISNIRKLDNSVLIRNIESIDNDISDILNDIYILRKSIDEIN